MTATKVWLVQIPVGTTFAMVDDIDVDRVQGVWYEAKHGRTSYAARTVRRPDGSKGIEYMHRLIAGEDWPEVDHRNGNGLDNRRHNLRPATREQQTRNMGKKRGTSARCRPTSRFKGVSLHVPTGLWRARIRVGQGQTIWLGYFRAEVAAAHAYDDAARQHHREYATVNFPRPGERSAI